jgi:hypothetical protein
MIPDEFLNTYGIIDHKERDTGRLESGTPGENRLFIPNGGTIRFCQRSGSIIQAIFSRSSVENPLYPHIGKMRTDLKSDVLHKE